MNLSKIANIFVKGLFLLLCVILLASCAEEDVDPPTAPTFRNPFAGSWQISFEGRCPGNGELTIGIRGEVSGVVGTQADCIQIGEEHTISGAVSESGAIDGQIHEGNETVGSVVGIFADGAASGTYQFLNGRAGAWIARSTIPKNPFIGNWNISFHGVCAGEGQLNINATGEFRGNVATPAECEQLGGAHIVYGTVSETGIISTGHVGEGLVSVGSFLGLFSGTSGNGTYALLDGKNGTWSASKL